MGGKGYASEFSDEKEGPKESQVVDCPYYMLVKNSVLCVFIS